MFKLISSQGQIFSQLQSFSHQAKNYLTAKYLKPSNFFLCKKLSQSHKFNCNSVHSVTFRKQQTILQHKILIAAKYLTDNELSYRNKPSG